MFLLHSFEYNCSYATSFTERVKNCKFQVSSSDSYIMYLKFSRTADWNTYITKYICCSSLAQLTTLHWMTSSAFNGFQSLTREEKLTTAQIVRKCSGFYGILKFITVFTSLLLISILNQINPVYICTPNFSNVHSNILPSMPRSTKWSLQVFQ